MDQRCVEDGITLRRDSGGFRGIRFSLFRQWGRGLDSRGRHMILGRLLGNPLLVHLALGFMVAQFFAVRTEERDPFILNLLHHIPKGGMEGKFPH